MPGVTALDSSALKTQVDTLAAQIPAPSTNMPSPEATTATPGTNQTKFAQEGHQHPRLTSTTLATLAADGTATVVFTRTFSAKPGVVITEVDSNASQPLTPAVLSYQQDGQGRYVGCTIKGYRSQLLPVLSPLSGSLLLTGLITGVNALNAMLSSFNIFGGSASGASVSVVAIARSDV
jgi:hypothetical protein